MKIFFYLLLVFSCQISFSQTENGNKIYLDSLKNNATEENYVYYRIINHVSPEKFTLTDYYKSEKIQMKGNSIDEFGQNRNGEFVFFYENGIKRESVIYKDNYVSGNYYSWYEDASKKEVGFHKEIDEKTKETQYLIQDYWDINKLQIVKNGNGFYKNEYSKGKIVEGLKDSIWTGINKLPKYKYTEEYDKGKLKNGVSIDSNGISYSYTIFESKPVPKNGIKDFYKFISKNFKNPYIKGLSGKLIMGFVINESGKIVDIKVVKKMGYGIDEEGIRLLESYSDWYPAKRRGINIRCTYTLPIMIQETK